MNHGLVFSLFPLGDIVGTPGALSFLDLHQVEVLALLRRHAVADWGCVGPDDAALNNQGLGDGSRLLSSYEVGPGKVWIITEADRSVTTVLLPSEY